MNLLGAIQGHLIRSGTSQKDFRTDSTMLKIKILNWVRYNPRGDIKHPTWFRFDNDFFFAPEMHSFTNDERLVWIFLLSVRARQQEEMLNLTADYIATHVRTSSVVVCKALEKLQHSQLLKYNADGIRTDAYVSGQNPAATNERDEREAPTELSSSEPDDPPATLFDIDELPEPEAKLPPLAKLYNELRGKLPEVRSVSPKKRRQIALRLKERPDLDEWRVVFSKAAASSFLNGNGHTGFVADFWWLLKNEDNHVKTFQGNYDDRKGALARADTAQVDWLAEAEHVLQAVSKFSSHESTSAEAFLGPERWARVRAMGGLTRVRSLAKNEFTARTVAGWLRSAALFSAQAPDVRPSPPPSRDHDPPTAETIAQRRDTITQLFGK